MKSNPYVYPTKDFLNLSNRNFKKNIISKKEISLKDLKNEIDRKKEIKIRPKGKNLEEKIFNFFLEEKIRFGDKKLVADYKNYWIERISFFTKKKKPLQFTILGFPFKMPVPLKTKRVLPDMGEVLALAQLRNIGLFIKNIYPAGAKISVFTEGCFAGFIGLSKSSAQKYEKYLSFLSKEMAMEDILILRPLSEMEKSKDFLKLFKQRKKKNELDFQRKNPEFMKKFKKAHPSMFRIVNSSMYSKEILMDVYNNKINDSDLPPAPHKARKDILNRTEKALIQYFAYLETRDDLDYLEKTIPNYLALSVSPKPYRLGIIPVAEHIKILPYHGVTFFDSKKNKWDICYLVDLERRNEKYKEIWLRKEKESAPFYYEKA